MESSDHPELQVYSPHRHQVSEDKLSVVYPQHFPQGLCPIHHSKHKNYWSRQIVYEMHVRQTGQYLENTSVQNVGSVGVPIFQPFPLLLLSNNYNGAAYH